MQQRPLDFHSMDDIVSEIDRLHAGGYTKAGEWDLGQICRHLEMAMDRSINGFEFKAPFFVRPLVPIFRKQVFGKRRIKAGLKAPAPFIPEPTGDDAGDVASAKAMVEKIKGFSGPYANHPFFGKLTREQWYDFHEIHSAHHLGFLVPKG